MLASNRQKKVLRLFNFPFGPTISTGAGGWEIADILSNDEAREHWDGYLFLTGDFGSDSDQLAPHDPVALLNTVIPDDWNCRAAAQQFKDELIGQILHDGSPFDSPMPDLVIDRSAPVENVKSSICNRATSVMPKV
jgi:hypothetical protein